MKAFIAALAVVSLSAFAEAIFPIVGVSSVAGPSIILAATSGTAANAAIIPTLTAVAGGAITLKAASLLIGSTLRAKRSVEEAQAKEDLTFSFIAQQEPQACYRRLICDLASGEWPKSDNDVILNLFEKDVPNTSAKFDFAIAAQVGKALRNVQACELRYSCPLTGEQIASLI